MEAVNELEGFEDPLDYFYDDDVYYEETIYEVWKNCVVPSISSIQFVILKIIAVNIIFGAAVSKFKLPEVLFHILSSFGGIYLICTLESTSGKVVIAIFTISSYTLLYLVNAIKTKAYSSHKIQKNKLDFISSANIIKYTILTTLVLCEYILLEGGTWLEVRGVIMVFTMKLISLAEDVDKKLISLPTPSQYFGYVLCSSNVLFGPWMPFQDYVALLKYPTKKNIWWILAILKSLILSLIFMIISNCIVSYLIVEDSNKWLIAFKEAFSFRSSHYFVCYLSEASMLAAGYKNAKIWYSPDEWRYFITDPLNIEFPKALSLVVTHWNRPMHDFLKKYIYRAWLPLGKFYAILTTFIASSCLHGFEIKVSVVLIMIGLFSYIQFAVRDYFAETFSCCIKVYPCKDQCKHVFKRNNLRCRVCQVIFSLFTVLHLVYLGMLMDPSTDKIGIYEKWRNLYFISFWVITFNVLIIL